MLHRQGFSRTFSGWPSSANLIKNRGSPHHFTSRRGNGAGACAVVRRGHRWGHDPGATTRAYAAGGNADELPDGCMPLGFIGTSLEMFPILVSPCSGEHQRADATKCARTRSRGGLRNSRVQPEEESIYAKDKCSPAMAPIRSKRRRGDERRRPPSGRPNAAALRWATQEHRGAVDREPVANATDAAPRRTTRRRPTRAHGTVPTSDGHDNRTIPDAAPFDDPRHGAHRARRCAHDGRHCGASQAPRAPTTRRLALRPRAHGFGRRVIGGASRWDSLSQMRASGQTTPLVCPSTKGRSQGRVHSPIGHPADAPSS